MHTIIGLHYELAIYLAKCPKILVLYYKLGTLSFKSSICISLLKLPWDFLWHPSGDVPAVLPGHLPALSLWNLSWHLPGHHLALGHRDRLARLFGDLLGHFGAGDLWDFGAHLPGDVLGDLPRNVATPLTLNLTTVFNWLIVALLPEIRRKHQNKAKGLQPILPAFRC